jgi:hypothetical protein
VEFSKKTRAFSPSRPKKARALIDAEEPGRLNLSRMFELVEVSMSPPTRSY